MSQDTAQKHLHQATVMTGLGEPQRHSGPPSFCRWRALLGVAAISILSSWLVALGGAWPLKPAALGLLMLYALALGLFCAMAVCICRRWLQRLSSRDAWLFAWFVVVVSAVGFSYGTGIISTVLGFGPGQEALSEFVRKSTVAAAIVTVAMFRYLFIRTQWQSEMLAEAEARVQALQARIRPHFLFNSLNTIASLIHDNPDSAERATEDLAALFRGGMRRSDEMIPLADELELGRRYLQMEQRRLGDRLKVEWNAEDLPVEEKVLPMMLQPLLENAVTHGIQPRTEGGTVQVFGRREGEQLVVTISNPLSGASHTAGNGMALSNIRSRLLLTYNGLASLVTSQDEDAFYAVLSLPYVAPADR